MQQDRKGVCMYRYRDRYSAVSSRVHVTESTSGNSTEGSSTNCEKTSVNH